MKSISNHADQIGIAPLCQALGVSRATYYRSLNPAPVPKGSTPRPLFNNALSECPASVGNGILLRLR
jgi:hypothetical protein